MISMATASTPPCPTSSPCEVPLIRTPSQWCMRTPFPTHCNQSHRQTINRATVASAHPPAPPQVASATVPTRRTWRTMTTRCNTQTTFRLPTQPHIKRRKTPHPPVAHQRQVTIINNHYQLQSHPIYHGTNFETTTHTLSTLGLGATSYECLVNYIPVHKVNPVQWIPFFSICRKQKKIER